MLKGICTASLLLGLGATTLEAAPMTTVDFNFRGGSSTQDTASNNNLTWTDTSGSNTGRTLSITPGGLTGGPFSLVNSASNGLGVDASGVAGASGDNNTEMDSRYGTTQASEYMEFTFSYDVHLVSLSTTGVGSLEQFTLSIAGGAPITKADSDHYTFPANTLLTAGQTLRVTAIDKSDNSGETLMRITALTVMVPEPGSLLAIGLFGSLLLGGRRRR
jgi:hypothetical protein